MSEQYEFHRTSSQSAIGSDKVLAETGTTRLLLRYEAVQNANNPDAKIKVAFIHQRKSPKGDWQDSPNVPPSSLKAGEQVKFSLHSEPTLKLYQHLRNLYAVATKGLSEPGKHGWSLDARKKLSRPMSGEQRSLTSYWRKDTRQRFGMNSFGQIQTWQHDSLTRESTLNEA